MAKTTDVPVELREFNRLFCELEYTKWAASVFDDFLDYLIQCFLLDKEENVRQRLMRDYGKKYDVFPQLFRELVLLMNRKIVDQHDWYDPLGTYYEIVTSRSKSSAMGQFFTPASVVDMMTKVNATEPVTGKTVNDPACGSGRTLLSFHARNPGNRMYGEDLDPMCVKMCAVNFCLHGVIGQVCHIDTLRMEWLTGGYETWVFQSLPIMRRISREESRSWMMWQRRAAEVEQPAPVEEIPEPPARAPQQPGVQLSLF